MNILRFKQLTLSFCAGLITVFGFAPFGIFPLTVFSLAVLFMLWLRAENARIAAWIGWAFGLGVFGAGIGWIYIALHDYGDMPCLLALLATFLFVAFYALFPAVVGYAQAKFKAPTWSRLVIVMPALWVLAEWARGQLFTGFPWLTFGYSQAAASPLAGYAPLLGVYGVSLLLAVSASLLLLLWKARWNQSSKSAWVILILLWTLGAVLREIEWTRPQGQPIKVSLAQGNIPQEMKFREETLTGTLETYRKLIQQSDARLIVLPETALPLQRQELPENYVTILRDHARKQNGDIITGAFEQEQGNYYNSVFTLGTAESQSYRKNHLLPFGEFIPLRSVLGWLINDALKIPMGDLARGGINQPLLNVAGQKIAVNICYEDAFGEELIRPLPEATLLVNVSNDAWYGNSYAAMQHNQLSQMRALETGRMVLRATNTGVTSLIGRNGRIIQMLPQHVEGLLTGQAQGYVGSTPYVRWGNAGVLILFSTMLGCAWWLRKR